MSKKHVAKRVVLGEGEVVGHKHILQSEEDILVEQTNSCIKYLLKGTGVLTHDEHDRIVHTPGKFRSYHQVELNPLDGTVSIVFD